MTIKIPLDLIQANPWQTRVVPEGQDPTIVELAEDIAAHGLLQTPVGRLSMGGKGLDAGHTTAILVQTDIAHALEEAGAAVQLAFGHRRLVAYWDNLKETRSAVDAYDWTSMPVEILVLSDEEMADMAWSENEKRKEHTPLDRALAIQKRMQDFGWTQTQIADHLGISRPAVSNALRLLRLPDEVQEALGNGTLSERQAMALAGLFDLPEAMLKNAEEVYYTGSERKPSYIVKMALQGASSDEIRKRVSDLALQFGKSLNDVDWSLDEVFSIENICSATCRECWLRMKDRNMCTDGLCFQAKKTHFERQYLDQASQASGIQPLEREIGEYYVTDFHYSNEFETIRQAGCENLRLKYTKTDGRKRDDSLEEQGYPNAVVVCSKRAGYCTCLKGIDYARQQEKYRTKTPPQVDNSTKSVDSGTQEPVYEPEPEEAHMPSAEELLGLARQGRSEKRQIGQAVARIQKKAGELIARELAKGYVEAWRLVIGTLAYELDLEKTKELDLDGLQKAIGVYVAARLFPYNPDNAEEIVEAVNKKLGKYGLPGLVLLEDDQIGISELIDDTPLQI